ncbi:MAG: sodium:proton exchanger, partial [Thermoleophilia bacterium]|nr:sodium:proton exchanger [Thermoleophilia bacterium]
AMLVVYGFWVQSYLKGSKRGGGEAAGATADERAALAAPADEAPVAAAHAGPRVAFGVSLALLAVAGVGAAFVSEWFVQGIEPAVQALGISEAFAGLVIVAIAGNAVENATAVVLAAKGQSELALSVVKNSVSQISVFLFPVLVLVSQGFDTPLTFGMDPVWIAALALTAITVWQITGDGIAAVWEGVALIAFYVILATVAFYE